MVRQIRNSMLAVFIVALSAVIAYSSTRWQQPAPPKNDLERLGLNGPVYQAAFSRNSDIKVTYRFDLDGNISEEILYRNNQPYEQIYYSAKEPSQQRNQLYTEIPVESSLLIHTDCLVKKGNRKDFDWYGNWTAQAVKLVSTQSDYQYSPVEIQAWTDKRSIVYFDDPTLQPICRQIGPASMDFAAIP